MVRGPQGAFRPLAGGVTTGARSLKTFPVKVSTARSGWSAERGSRLVGVDPRGEFQDQLDGRLGSVPERAQRIAGSGLAISQLLGFAEVLELLE